MTNLRRFVLLALGALLLTACEMRAWLDIDLSDPSAGEVIATFGFDEQLRSMMEEGAGGGDIFGEIEAEASGEGWEMTSFVDGDIEGFTITRTFSSIDELNEIITEAPSLDAGSGGGGPMVEGVSITDTGDTIRFEGSIPGAGGGELEGVEMEEVLGIIDFDARVSVTFPGEVIEHNGELTGRTVTWQFFEDNLDGVEMFAEARKGGGVSWPLIGGILLVLVAVGVVGYRVMSARKTEVVSPQAARPQEQSEADGAVSDPVDEGASIVTDQPLEEPGQ